MGRTPERVTAFAPGRVNLIGEHTDYNNGLALPFAISRGISVRAEPLRHPRYEVAALDLGETDAFTLATAERVGGWRAYVRGTVTALAAELAASGHELSGARIQIVSTLPPGGGLSSSAALTVALCLALVALSDVPAPEPLALARLCSGVEHDWAGARSGLLDQLAVLCGGEAHALRIDFASLEITPVPLALGEHDLVVLDSGETHSHGAATGTGQGGSYNARRAECARACELLGVASLRAATPQMAAALPAPLAARVLHVITENERVEQAVSALHRGDLRRLGELLDESHASLRERYEISTSAVERTALRLRAAGAIGARIIGGGFGGHVLALLPPGAQAPDGAVPVIPGAGAHLL